MSTPVMTDDEIRDDIVKELADRVSDFRHSARQERDFAASLVAGQDDAASECLHYASHFDRCAAHYQQAIDLLTNAPMPERSET